MCLFVFSATYEHKTVLGLALASRLAEQHLTMHGKTPLEDNNSLKYPKQGTDRSPDLLQCDRRGASVMIRPYFTPRCLRESMHAAFSEHL